jgi:hypothetical protein
MTGTVVRLPPRAAAPGRAFSPPLPVTRAEPLPAPCARPARFPGDKSDTPAPAAVGLNGEPLYDTPPALPSSDLYAVAPGVVWHRLPTESEDQFSARVRTGAAACGLERVTTWRRHEAQGA